MPYIPRQYESAKLFLKNYNNLGNIVDPLDNARVSAANLYDDFYYNRPETFRVTRRGSLDTEIYLPSTKKIVDATARYLAVDPAWNITGGSASALNALFDDIKAREEIPKRFVRGKRSGLTRGDLMWYITADDRKPKGKRISINTIHPNCVFPIEEGIRVVGYHIVDIVKDPRDVKIKESTKQIARRQTYRKEENGLISTECYGFELGAWDDRYLEPDKIKMVWRWAEKKFLPQQITQLPVYHIPNNDPDGSTWGLSQVAGIEYIINALNQSMTTEDLSLVLAGLGVYVTTAAPPIDPTTNKPGRYKLHPGNVIQLTGEDRFDRVSGITSVQPFQDHIGSLDEWATTGAGIPDMATGKVDVSVAQSGIALALKMGPIIAENEDKQLGIESKWNQLGYDLLNGWFPAFEGLNSDGAQFKTTFGDPMPKNRETYVAETIDLFQEDLITLEEVRERLEKIGYKNSASLTEKLWEQRQKKAEIASGDAFAAENGLLGGTNNGQETGQQNQDQQRGSANGGQSSSNQAQ